MDFTPSKYQQKILDCFINTNENILVNALAGSGKSSTICLLTEHLDKSSIYIAFNASVVDEFKKKIKNPKVKVMTMHSLAYSIMLYNVEQESQKDEKPKGFGRQRSKKEVHLDNFKPYKILDEELTKRYGRYMDFSRRVFYKDQYVSLYNLCCLTMTDMSSTIDVDKLIDDHTLFVSFGEEDFPKPSIREITETLKVLDTKSKQAFEVDGSISFTDMLYITYWKLKSGEWEIPYWAQYTNVMVDECLPGTSYVYTKEGKGISLKELYKKVNQNKETDIFIKSFNTKTEQFEFKRVLNVKEKGTQKTYTIKTEGLNKVTATKNHPFLTQRGFVALSDLKIGKDYLYLDKPQKQKIKYILNDDQLQLVLASSIGDGNLIKMSGFNTYRIKFTQGDAQYNYFNFKKKMLNCSYERKIKSGYTQKLNINQSSSKVFILPSDRWTLMKKVDERFFAVWYQDDGNISFRETKNNGTVVSKIIIACNNLSNDEVIFLQSLLKEKMNVEAIVYKTKGYNELRLNMEDAILFLKKIAPYMNEDCAYKNPFFESKNLYSWNYDFKSYGGNYVKEIVYAGEKQVYDIEVEDNHNFVVWEHGHPESHNGVVVHNCQDLNKLQQNFLPLIKRKAGRYVFVGDTNQAIYYFSAADANSMKRLSIMFTPIKTFDLPVCYRCAKTHLKRVNKEFGIPILPRDNAPEGFIKTIEKENIKDYVQPGDLVISRKNKWLADCILSLAKNGIPVYMEDKAMVDDIKKIITKAKCTSIRGLKTHLEKAITSYYDKVKKLATKKAESVEDNEKKAEEVADATSKIDNINFLNAILKSYIKAGNSLSTSTDNFTKYITKLLNVVPSPDCVRICSVHKAKGLEAENVFVLNEGKIAYDFRQSKEQNVQEKNLSYISMTRAKNGLYLVKEPTKANTTKNGSSYLLPNLESSERGMREAIVNETFRRKMYGETKRLKKDFVF